MREARRPARATRWLSPIPNSVFLPRERVTLRPKLDVRTARRAACTRSTTGFMTGGATAGLKRIRATMGQESNKIYRVAHRKRRALLVGLHPGINASATTPTTGYDRSAAALPSMISEIEEIWINGRLTVGSLPTWRAAYDAAVE